MTNARNTTLSSNERAPAPQPRPPERGKLLTDTDLDQAAERDYDTIRRAIRFLSEAASHQPELADLAAHLELSPSHVQRIFKRWCGLSPKEFSQALTIDHARRMLALGASVLDAAHATGLSGGSRLHDLFITHEAVTPGDVKRRGADLDIAWGWHATPFGEALAAMTTRGIIGLAFLDEELPDARASTFDEMRARWPAARWRLDPAASAGTISSLFAGTKPAEPVPVVLIGTDFEVRVWRLLTRIPPGHAASYSDIASRVCSQRAARAVGAAVGRNPLAFVVPCHRVLRADGGLGGYHWNVTRKRALIGWEAGRVLQTGRQD